MPFILVTGASGNLGRAVVDRFASAGNAVVGTIHSKSGTAAENVQLIKVDLTDEGSVDTFVEATLKRNGIPDIAVFTAGGFAMGDIKTTDSKQLLQQYELNFLSTYNLARRLFVLMREKGRGRIYFTAAAAATDMSNATDKIAYALSKSLVIRLAELLNADAGSADLTVTVVAPEIIDTPPNRKAMPAADFSKWITPGHIADIIYKHSNSGSPTPFVLLS